MNVARGAWALVLSCLASVAVGINTGTLRSAHVAQSFVQSLQFKYTLRVCNAYPFPSSIDAFVHQGSLKLNSDPLMYKTCADFTTSIATGDRIEFKVGDINAGTFTIQELPNNDAILMLILYRHDAESSAIAFESHVFSNVATAQVAILDVYRGPSRSELRIDHAAQPGPGPANVSQSELLRFDSVVAVDPGVYELALRDPKNASARRSAELVALPRGAYVAIRCGVDAAEGADYPEELVIFPQSDKAMLGGGARVRPSVCGFMAVLLSLLSSTFFQTWS